MNSLTPFHPQPYALGMIPVWYLLVATPVALVAGMAVGWAMAAVGVVGVVRSLKASLDTQQSQLDTLADRIQREVKTRAGDAAAKSRTDKQLSEEATRHLGESEARPQGFLHRPSTLRLA